MEKEIEYILNKYYRDENYETGEAIKAILLLFGVSGNEANPKENKKAGEVAFVCPSCFEKWDIQKHNACKCGAILVIKGANK